MIDWIAEGNAATAQADRENPPERPAERPAEVREEERRRDLWRRACQGSRQAIEELSYIILRRRLK